MQRLLEEVVKKEQQRKNTFYLLFTHMKHLATQTQSTYKIKIPSSFPARKQCTIWTITPWKHLPSIHLLLYCFLCTPLSI